uniref:Cysteine-rich motor neuron 1 protein n=1 Tax=Lygus hesperus TaxID=30085 RepID=A0A0A9W3C1_LYGHE
MPDSDLRRRVYPCHTAGRLSGTSGLLRQLHVLQDRVPARLNANSGWELHVSAELCHIPQCPQNTKMKVIQYGTGQPGACCDTWNCVVDQDNPPLINCPPYHKWTGTECVCNPTECPPSPVCEPGLMPVTTSVDDCCVISICVNNLPGCPQDSYQNINGCTCYPCEPPPCGPKDDVSISFTGLGTPGSCCNIYSCTPKRRVDCGACGIPSPDGVTCVCDNGCCPLPPMCGPSQELVTVNKATKIYPMCCDTYACVGKILCPQDSVMGPNGDCICSPCPTPLCAPGTQIVDLQKGSGMPGGCCDAWKCAIGNQPGCPPPPVCDNGFKLTVYNMVQGCNLRLSTDGLPGRQCSDGGHELRLRPVEMP